MMTVKEAIERLNNWDKACPNCEKRYCEEDGCCKGCQFIKAIDLAIKALKNKNTVCDECVFKSYFMEKLDNGEPI